MRKALTKKVLFKNNVLFINSYLLKQERKKKMLKFRKIFSAVTALVMSASLLPISPVSAENADGEAIVVYENTFDNGAASVVSYQNPFLSMKPNLQQVSNSEINGNMGIRLNQGSWLTPMTFVLDFTQGDIGHGIQDGVITASFDFSTDAESGADYAIIGANMTSAAEGDRMLYFHRGSKYEVLNAVYDWGGDSNNMVDLDASKVYNMKIVMDLTNDKADYYLDDALVKTQTNWADMTVNNLTFALSGLIDYFDNFKVTFNYAAAFENKVESDNIGNIFYEDEPMNFNLKVTNFTSADKEENVTIKIKDAYGSEVYSDVKTVQATAASCTEVPFTTNLPKFGTYFMTVTSDNAPEFKTRLSRSVKAPVLNEKSGVGAHFDGRHPMDVPGMFDIISNAGFGTVRTDWHCYKNDNGTVYDYTNTDNIFGKTIAEANARGVDLLAILGLTEGSDADGGFNTDSTALESYQAYTQALASALVGKVDNFEIGNENNHTKRIASQADVGVNPIVLGSGYVAVDGNYVYTYDENNKAAKTVKALTNITITQEDGKSYLTATKTIGGTTLYEKQQVFVFDSGENYAKILKAAYNGLKAGNSNATVATGGSSIVYDDDNTLYRNQKSFASGLLDTMKNEGSYYFDAYSIHPYHVAQAPEVKDQWIENTTWSEQAQYGKDAFTTYEVPADKAIWATEFGYSAKDSEADSTNALEKASWIVRTMLLNEIGDYHDKMYVYDILNDGLDGANSEHNFGMINYCKNAAWNNVTAYAAKPQYLAMAQYNKMLAGAELKSSNVDGNNYKTEFTREEDTVFVLWNTDNNKENVTVSAKAENVKAYDYFGNEIAASADGENVTVAVGDTPVYVEFDNSKATEEVWYYNTFDNGTSDLKWIENDYLNGGYNTSSIGLSAVTVDGNTGVTASNTGAWKQKQTFFFDFTKGGTQAAPTMGKYKFSFDFKMRDTSTADIAGFGINMSKDGADTTNGNLSMQIGRTGENVGFVGTKNSAESWDVGTGNGTFTYFDIDNNVHTMDIILNLNGTDDARFNYYLDGERIGVDTRYWGKTLSNMALSLNAQFTYVDNIKVSKLRENVEYSFKAEAEKACGYVDVVFPVVMNVSKGTFTVDGKAADKVDWLDVYTARVYNEALYTGGAHTVAVADATDLFGVAPANSEASFETVETKAENVLYYNTFDNGSDSMDWDSWKDCGECLVGKTGGNKPVTATYNGNKGIAGASGQWPTATQIRIDFTKGGTKDPVSTGVYKFSWDLSTRAVNSCDWNSTGINMSSHWQGISLLQYYNGDLIVIEKGNQNLDKDTVHSIDTIIDFDNDRVNFYVDGVMVYERGWFTPNMSTFDINFCQCIDYFDNLKVSKLDKTTEHTYVPTVETEVANNYVDIAFPAAMNVAKGTFKVDGNAAEAKWLSASKVRVYSESLNKTGEHTISFEDICDNYGVAPAVSQLTVNFTIYADGDVVLYENDFNNGAEDLTYDEHETYYAGIDKNAVNKFYQSTKNGNPGAYFWRDEGNRTVVVDFNNALTSGKIKISFDFMMQSVGENTLETTTLGVNMSQHWTSNVMGEFQTVEVDGNKIGRFYVKPNAEEYISNLKEKYTKEISLNELHTFDMVLPIDPGNTIGTFYIDGEKIESTSHYWGDNVPNIALNFNEYFKYVDNVKISYLKEGTFEVTGAKAPAAGQDYIDIYTSEMPNSAITADMVTVNGENATEVSVLTNPGAYENNQRYVIRAKLASPVVSGETYEISVANTATNFLGTAINSRNNTATVETLAQTSLTIENGKVNALIVNTENAPIKPVLVVANYDEYGKMLGVALYDTYTEDGKTVTEITNKATITVDVSGISGTVKAFIWNGLDGMKPMVPAAQ